MFIAKVSIAYEEWIMCVGKIENLSGEPKICLTKKANYDICKKEKQPTIVDCFLRGAWRIRTAVDGFADR